MIEVLKQMQEALREYHYYTIDAGLPNQSMLNKGYAAFQAGRQAIAELESQQPMIDKSAAIHTCTPPQDEYMTLKEKVNLAMAWYDSGCEDRAEFQTLMESILAQPPQRTWVGLTDELRDGGDPMFHCGAKWAERKLKEKNGFAEEKNILPQHYKPFRYLNK